MVLLIVRLQQLSIRSFNLSISHMSSAARKSHRRLHTGHLLGWVQCLLHCLPATFSLYIYKYLNKRHNHRFRNISV